MKPDNAPILRYQNALRALIQGRIVVNLNPIHLPNRTREVLQTCLMDLLQLLRWCQVSTGKPLDITRFRFCWKPFRAM